MCALLFPPTMQCMRIRHSICSRISKRFEAASNKKSERPISFCVEFIRWWASHLKMNSHCTRNQTAPFLHHLFLSCGLYVCQNPATWTLVKTSQSARNSRTFGKAQRISLPRQRATDLTRVKTFAFEFQRILIFYIPSYQGLFAWEILLWSGQEFHQNAAIRRTIYVLNITEIKSGSLFDICARWTVKTSPFVIAECCSIQIRKKRKSKIVFYCIFYS